MKVYLDDERQPPDASWTPVRWPAEAIALLKTGAVTEISLDHDLGGDYDSSGYAVLLWLEEQVAARQMVPPRMTVHTMNAPARVRMEAAVRRIMAFHAGNLEQQEVR